MVDRTAARERNYRSRPIIREYAFASEVSSMIRTIKYIALTAAAILPLLGDVGPALAQAAPPPPPQAEAVPPPPVVAPGAPYWVWQPGYWRWNGRRYAWFQGRYVHAPYAQAMWVPGEWVVVRGRWVWHGGHWRR
jgi:hypothetical protein